MEIQSAPCTMCKKDVQITSESNIRNWKRVGRVYCSEECKAGYKSLVSSSKMAETNRKYASARMTERNPMRKQEAREKMSATLREIGHKPKVRGGNGKGPTVPQKMLADALGWPMEHVVKTGHCRDGSGYPSCYKIDVADPATKTAVEVDGYGHFWIVAKERDAKKRAFLESLGWTVLRFSNKQVIEDLEMCVQEVTSSISKSMGITTTS